MKPVLLIGFYNQKALGVRYLANALKGAGYTPHILFFKGFNSSVPRPASQEELRLLLELIDKIKPIMIGLSVMSSLYLETSIKVSRTIRENTDIPVMWGGVFATLEPARAAEQCDYVIRGEGEYAIVDLLQAIEKGEGMHDVLNVAYKNEDGQFVQNDVRPLEEDIDKLGRPQIGGENLYLIENDKMETGDPQLKFFSYELLASRGCPFSCSYCSAVNLRRVYAGKGKFVRFRSVESVMEELNEAKQKMKRLRMIHFWDEIFSDEDGWVEEFTRRYRKEIGVPFVIWGHPLKVNEKIMRQLVAAGLHQISVGVQSGSPEVRKNIFHRGETQEQVYEASRILARCKIPQVYFDLMICHPLETVEQLKETFWFCTNLTLPFRLNIHGLAFLPATDIVTMAQERGVYSQEEIEHMMYGTMAEQYQRYWGGNAEEFVKSPEKNVWSALIYLTQFNEKTRQKAIELTKIADTEEGIRQIFALKKKMAYRDKIRHYTDKARLLLRLSGSPEKRAKAMNAQ